MRLLSLIKKEYDLFVRNKKQVWTVILLPLLFSLIYAFMFSLSGIKLSVIVCDLDNSDYSHALINGISSSFDTKVFAGEDVNYCSSIVREAIIKGTMLGIIVPSSFSENIREYEQPVLSLYFDNSKPNLGFFAQSYIMNKISSFNTQILREAEQVIKEDTNQIESDLRSTLEVLTVLNFSIPENIQGSYNNLYLNVDDYHNKIKTINSIDLEFLVNPVSTQLIGIFQGSNSDGFSFSVLYTVLNIIVILLLSSVSMVYDKKNGFLIRLKTSTTPIIYYIISKIIFFTIIGLAIFVLSFLIFLLSGAYFNVNFATLIIALLMISVISTLIGCIIGLSSKNESSSTMLSVFIGFMFLILSGLFYPIDLLPEAIKGVMVLLPTNFEINILSNALVLGTNFELMSQNFYYLLGYSALFIAATYYLIIKE